jgi:hypothetical protein
MKLKTKAAILIVALLLTIAGYNLISSATVEMVKIGKLDKVNSPVHHVKG